MLKLKVESLWLLMVGRIILGTDDLMEPSNDRHQTLMRKCERGFVLANVTRSAFTGKWTNMEDKRLLGTNKHV